MYGNGILSFKCMLFRGKASAVLIKAEKRDIEFIVHREARKETVVSIANVYCLREV